jgi:Raf kinase inhibitor-like YbhB/YbcL family protein
MQVTSTAFENGESIPKKYTCDGENINPPLTFSNIPAGVVSFVLIVEDPDSPNGNFTHWVMFNIPGSMLQILEHSVPDNALQGKNDFGNIGYGGPCPQTGTHRYIFNVYALDRKLDLMPGVTKQSVKETMQGHIMDTADITGVYTRS